MRSLALLGLVSTSGCILLVEYVDPPGGGGHGGSGAAVAGAGAGAGAAGGGGAAGTGGTGGDGGGPGGTGGTAECPDAPGPPMVQLDTAGGGTYCIDSTEVTMSQYEQFLSDVGPVPDLIAGCDWNDDLMPGGVSCPAFDPKNSPTRPVVCVDWCDAAAYCSWAGKRLCGRFVSGPLTVSDISDPATNQWYRACSAAGTTTYPYGNTYVPAVCSDFRSGAVSNVMSHPGCEGGVPGLFDMSGNVYEWIDGCEAESGGSDVCAAAGGSYLNGETFLTCSTWAPPTLRSAREPVIGFRCCSP